MGMFQVHKIQNALQDSAVLYIMQDVTFILEHRQCAFLHGLNLFPGQCLNEEGRELIGGTLVELLE
jgi:hypothetical protein